MGYAEYEKSARNASLAEYRIRLATPGSLLHHYENPAQQAHNKGKLAMFKSWKPVIQTDSSGKWHDNALRFETQGEAQENARDLARRWFLVTAHSAMPDEASPNYRYESGELVGL